MYSGFWWVLAAWCIKCGNFKLYIDESYAAYVNDSKMFQEKRCIKEKKGLYLQGTIYFCN